jgi:hypothetical protein
MSLFSQAHRDGGSTCLVLNQLDTRLTFQRTSRTSIEDAEADNAPAAAAPRLGR